MIEVNSINENKEITSNPVYQWDYGKTTHQITIPVVPRKKFAGFISVSIPTQIPYIYKYVLIQNKDGVQLVGSEKMYSVDTYGSMILDFNYDGPASVSTFIRTQKEYYRVVATNNEECNKYVDVPCEYDFKKDKLLTKHYDRIIAFNGRKLITDYFKIFNVGGSSE